MSYLGLLNKKPYRYYSLIDKATVDQILEAARVEEVVEDFVNLKRRGVNMIGKCPFHDEKTPSFTVSPSKNIYKCFGCGEGGFPVNFVMTHENMSFPEALKYLAKKYNIEIQEKEVSAEEMAARQIADSLYIVNDYAKDYFGNQLFNTDEGKSVGLSYFKNRGFLESTIKKWNLGYTNTDRDDFTRAAISKYYKKEHLKTLGLTSKSDIDFFRSRVMFAIHNLSGKVIAFGGRTLSSDKKIPKYMNSPESEIYNKSRSLYGLYFAKTAIRKADECIMVEGYTDVITLHQNQVENVVASSGTSLTSGQIHLVNRYTSNIKIIYDGDPAGIKAALRGVDLVLEHDMNVKIVMLPSGEDPDSFMKAKGTDGFKQYLADNEKDFLFFKIELLMSDAGNDPIKKTIVMKDIVGSIAKIPDQLKRAVYLQETSRILDVDESILISETFKIINKDQKKKDIELRRKQSRENKQNSNTPFAVATPKGEDQFFPMNDGKVPLPPGGFPHQSATPILHDEYQERDIIRILVNHGCLIYDKDSNVTVCQHIVANIRDDIDKIDNPLYKQMLEMAMSAIDRGDQVTAELYANTQDTNMSKVVVELMADPYTYAGWQHKGVYLQTQKPPEENQVLDTDQAILRFRLVKIKKLIDLVEKKIKEFTVNQNSSEEFLLNIRVLQKLKDERNTIAKKLNAVIF